MRFYRTLLASLVISAGANATPTLVDTSAWTADLSPSTSRLSNNDVWTGLESNLPKKTGNSSGSLISDFSTFGDFTFSGLMTPTFASNISCAGENTCNDNDILGILFGWQDSRNHYRLGFSQGDDSTSFASSDITGRNGLFLIKETDGRSNTIAHWSDVFWQEQQAYNFNVGRIGDDISFSLTGMALSTPQNQSGNLPTDSEFLAQNAELSPLNIGFSITDSTFLTGQVGVYTESQTGIFSELAIDQVVRISAPPVFATVLAAFLWSSSRRKLKVSINK